MLSKDAVKIKLIREALGLSQREFARLIGKTGAYICQVESGKLEPTYEVVETVISTFHIKPSWYVTGEGEMIAEQAGGDVAERLRLARKKREYSQEELADLVDCNRNTISLAENGKTSPSAALLHDIAERLWITEPWLRFGLGPMERSEEVADVLDKIKASSDVRDAVEMFLKWDKKDPATSPERQESSRV